MGDLRAGVAVRGAGLGWSKLGSPKPSMCIPLRNDLRWPTGGRKKL